MKTHSIRPSPSLGAVLKSILLLLFYPLLAFREARSGTRSASAALMFHGLGCIMTMILIAAVLSAINIGHKPESERLVNTIVLLVIYVIGGLRTVTRMHEKPPRDEPSLD